MYTTDRSDQRSSSPVRFSTVMFISLLAGFALLRVVDTYRVFNHTCDEAPNLGAGMEWVDRGQYTYEPHHPPMRAVFAVGPWLMGAHSHGAEDHWEEGKRILYESGSYTRTLTAARVAALPFFALSLGVIGLWAFRLAGTIGSVAAVLAYSMLPLALAHAGLANNDTLVTGTLTLALYALARWLDAPSAARAAAFGAAAALAVLSKFSALPFLGASALLALGVWLFPIDRRSRRARVRLASSAAVWAVLFGFAVLWAGYRFSLHPLTDVANRPHEALDTFVGTDGLLHDTAYLLAEAPVPLTEFLRGVLDVAAHNARGHYSYFMGSVARQGWIGFFPIGLLVKTPIPFLVLGAAGLCWLLFDRQRRKGALFWLPPLAVATILAASIPGSINIGMRHVLPIFPLAAIALGAATAAMWKIQRRRMLARLSVGFLFTWLVAGSIRAHPDYLAYFNECCDTHPERWLVNSDLDWGQDLDRLADALRRRKVDHLYLSYFGTADPARHGLPPFDPLPPNTPVRGWVAVSELMVALGTRKPPFDQFRWVDRHEPVERVGRSIRLYHFE